MLKSIKNVAVLVCVCSVITLLLAITNSITAPIIKKNENASANAAFVELMPDGAGFDAMDISSYTLPSTVAEVYKESANKGYIVKLVTSGYGADMVIMCGVTSDGKITGAKCLSSNETLGKEKTYGENFKNKDSAGVEAVDTIAGATKTTDSYKNAVKDALNTAIILGGGSVDIRNEEEILADNLSSALPSGSGKFTKVFLTEAVLVDAIYVADNQTGYVCVIGEQFIGVDANGTVITAGVENAQAAVDAVAAISSSALTDIDLSAFPELSYAVSAKKTATGNYVIETKGAGYGIKGGNEYHPASGEYIVVRVSITASGEIIDCITVSQAETSGLGDACAKEEFYGQFVSKNETNYTEIDAISGATITTDGYKQAISRAFEVLKVLKGGNR
jgi:electron transport complex protein RnfG